MLSEREKLEEELRFLKESYDIGVITDEEYKNGRQRIGAKIKAIEDKENEGDGLFKEEPEKAREAREKITTYDLGEKDDMGRKINQDQEQEETEEEPTEAEEDIFPLDSEEKKEVHKGKKIWMEEKQHEKTEDEIKFNKKTLVFAAVLIVAALGIWYFFFTGSDNANMSNDANTMANNAATLIACYSDKDCKEQGKIGSCANPGKENAECSYVDDIQVKLKIINSKECFNCDTGRIISILESFYPNLDIEEIDYDTAEGRVLADRFNINALPAYILNSSLSETYNYEEFFTAFNKMNDNFVMKDTVANANYYLNRKEIPNKLELFAQEGQEASDKAEANLKEFLEAFDGKVTFNKHDSDSALARELGLNSFPTFLINTKIKFGGVQAANTIKENFCRVNKLQECSLELSKSLV